MSTKITNYIDVSAVDFKKIKNSAIAVYSPKSNVIMAKGVFDKQGSVRTNNLDNYEVISQIRNNFNQLIPSVKVLVNSAPLPSIYSGKLSHNNAEEMDKFLMKQISDYVFIVVNSSENLNSEFSPTGFSNNISVFGVNTDNKVTVNFELWDVRSKSLILSYEVLQEGRSSLESSIHSAILYIKNEGKSL